MMVFREIANLICQGLLFGIGIGAAGLAAHLGGGLIAAAFNVDALIPSAILFFAVLALIGWTVDRFWPETWTYNPFP